MAKPAALAEDFLLHFALLGLSDEEKEAILAAPDAVAVDKILDAARSSEGVADDEDE